MVNSGTTSGGFSSAARFAGQLRVLVAIASYGTGNDQYLGQLLAEYARMPYEVDVVVLSNIEKELPPNVELRVGLPIKNPWSLPFAHKSVFVERQRDYDLYIYSEDDTLITQRQIEAFLDATEVLPREEVAGFLRTEEESNGKVYYSTAHSHYHWDSSSVCRRGAYTFAYFTNEHGACYILTREQLRQAIASGGFDVPPHEGKYDMLVSAATDPYTQCRLKKLICISRLDDFTCKHLTNKYIGRTGIEKALFDLQVRALLEIGASGTRRPHSVRVETNLPGTRWAKSYYELPPWELLAMIPPSAKRVLSLGCGWGKTEEVLIERGMEVSAVPLDIIIGRVAESRGVRVIPEGLEAGIERLTGEVFDVLLISGLIHLLEKPEALLRRCRDLLPDGGLILASFPNLGHLSIRLRCLTGHKNCIEHDSYGRNGLHRTSRRLVHGWLVSAGFTVKEEKATMLGRWKKYNQVTMGLLKDLWASEFAVSASKAAAS